MADFVKESLPNLRERSPHVAPGRFPKVFQPDAYSGNRRRSTLIKDAQGIFLDTASDVLRVRSSLQEDRNLSTMERMSPGSSQIVASTSARNFQEHRVIHCCFSVGMRLAFGY
jgi:hypothetical protein